MLTSLGTVHECYQQGQVYDVADAMGASWVRAGLARWVHEPPEYHQQFLARLDVGSGQPCLFLPFVGEFGHHVMTHIRLVHFHKASEKVVACRSGDEVLYPSATSFDTDWIDPIADIERVASHRATRLTWPAITARYPHHLPIEAGNLTPTQELICIECDKRIPFAPRAIARARGLHVDVVIGVRHRAFEPCRNWQHWQMVADALTAHGYTFATMGHRATSVPLAGQRLHTGDYDTSAAVECLQRCRLYVGNDSGGSHLAASVGSPMLVFRETASGSRDLFPRMMKSNPNIEVVTDGWDNPQVVIEAALKRLAGIHTVNGAVSSLASTRERVMHEVQRCHPR